jgi:hypothetical protein
MCMFVYLIANGNIKIEHEDTKQTDLQIKHVLGGTVRKIVLNSRFLY